MITYDSSEVGRQLCEHYTQTKGVADRCLVELLVKHRLHMSLKDF